MKARLWHLPILLLAAIMLAPLWLQVSGSLTDNLKMQTGVIPLLPQWPPVLLAYKLFFRVGGLKWLGMSALIATLAVVGQVFVATSAAYAFAWREFPGRDALFWLLVVSMTLPAQALLIPRYILIRKLGLSGLIGLLPAYWVATGSVFLLRQFCKSLSRDVLDAARIDGASEWALLFKLAIPMMQPAIVLIAIGAFIGAWGDVFWPQMVLRNTMTLPVGIYWLSHSAQAASGLGNIGGAMVLTMAGSVISLGPIVGLFLLFQDRLQGGYVEDWA